MNIAQLKQQLGNNLWHGENSHRQNRVWHFAGMPFEQRAVLTSLILPDTSRVWGIDISHWNIPPVNLQRMIDLYGLRFLIIKGCDGSIRSRYSAEHVATAKATGLPWGFYDWLYPNGKVSIDAQTTAWASQAHEFNPPMGIFIDAEWTNYGGLPANPNAADLQTAHDKTKAKYAIATTYTAKGYADTYLTGFDWSREELWVANYSNFPPVLPKGATHYFLHQFTSTLDGKQLDPNGNAELDGSYPYSDAEFEQRYGTVAEDVVSMPYAGVKRISGTRYGWKFELFITDPARANFEVVCLDALETVSSVARRKDAALAFNGGEWDRLLFPKDYSVASGIICKERVQAVPSLLIFDSGIVQIDHRPMLNVRHALSGLRYLIQGGVIQPYLSGTEPQYTEGHARSIHGIDSRGFHMCLTFEGAYPNQGSTLKQAAGVIKQYGAVTAFDSGGGGDAEVVLNGQLLTVPENISPITWLHFERPLPQVLLIYPQELIMTRYEAIAIGDNTRLRPDHNTLSPYLANYPKGTKFHGDVLFTATEQLKNADGLVVQMVGDKWLQVVDVNGTAKAGWVAIVHKGSLVCTLIDNQPPVATQLPDTLYIATKADFSDKAEYRKAV
jgi:hypothetical protein